MRFPHTSNATFSLHYHKWNLLECGKPLCCLQYRSAGNSMRGRLPSGGDSRPADWTGPLLSMRGCESSNLIHTTPAFTLLLPNCTSLQVRRATSLVGSSSVVEMCCEPLASLRVGDDPIAIPLSQLERPGVPSTHALTTIPRCKLLVYLS